MVLKRERKNSWQDIEDSSLRLGGKMAEPTMKVGSSVTAELAARRRSMDAASLTLTAFRVTIDNESFGQKLRLTMLRVMSLRNTPTVPSIVTARASSFARLASM